MKSHRFLLAAALAVCVLGLAATGCETIKGKIGRGSKDILTTAASKGEFNTFCEAVQNAGLSDMLTGPGPFTVFAPTDAAFQMLPPEKLAALMEPANKEQLAAILKHHVLQGKYSDKDLKKLGSLRALDGTMLMFAPKGDSIAVGDAMITTKNIKCKNGIMHVIDIVMMPHE
jgi:uncharacterized surface protein with fasciclin (FAS1) repeats